MAHIRALPVFLLAGLVILGAWAGPAAALEEADRLFLVGEKAFDDGLYPVSRRMLEQFVERFPSDRRAGEATLLLGKARLSQGAGEAALEAFRKAESFQPPPGKPGELRFWEAETFYRLKRWADARTAYAEVIAGGAGGARVADALYGLGWTELEGKRREPAATAFQRLVSEFPDHALAPTAAIQLARTLIELKRVEDAQGVLQAFVTKHPEHKLAPEARYWQARARLATGQTDQAVIDLRAFAKAHPAHELAPAARRAVLDTLMKEGRKSELADEYTALMSQKPSSADGLYDAGAIAGRLGRSRDAETAWGRLRKEFPEHALTGRASLQSAQAAFAKNAFRDAATLARAAAKSPEDSVRGEAFLLVGESEMKLKRPAQALPAFQAAADTAGLEPALHFRALAGTGLALEEQKQWTQAAKYYAEVAEKSPDKTLAAWAKTRKAAVTANVKPGPKPGGKAEKR
jgi:cellulose synthase operon protein C